MTDRDFIALGRAGDPDDQLGALIRKAGPRPSPPAEHLRRAKARVRDRWQRTIQRRRRARTWAAASTAAAAVVVAAAGLIFLRAYRAGPIPRSSPEISRVAAVAGSSWLRPGSAGAAASLLHPGDRVPAGAEISTGNLAGIALAEPDGRSLRLAQHSRVRFVSESTVTLEEGSVYVDGGRAANPGESPFTIRTPFGAVHEMGTQFEVRIEPESIRIRVREGSVRLDGDGRREEIAAGAQLAWDGQGDPAVEKIPVYGPSWQWAEEIAPARDLRGHTAREFLDWLARERGWKLSFTSVEVERRAAATTLSGSIEGLTLDEALEAVLPTCGLAAHAEAGVLTVSESAGGRAAS